MTTETDAEWAYGQPEALIHYVMDLEALVRWFALPFRYQDQEGEWHQNEPIWTVYDERGTYLPEADRLRRTWERVMGETETPERPQECPNCGEAGHPGHHWIEEPGCYVCKP